MRTRRLTLSIAMSIVILSAAVPAAGQEGRVRRLPASQALAAGATR